MKKKIINYVPFYIGQKIITYWGKIIERETIRGVLGNKVIFEFDENDNSILSSLDLDHVPPKGREPKLLLRSIEDMKQEQAEAIHKKYGFFVADLLRKDIRIPSELFMELIHTGFDVFGLIECGIAERIKP